MSASVSVVELPQPWKKVVDCEACKGSGTTYEDPLGDPDRCEDCLGEGKIERNFLREAFTLARDNGAGRSIRVEHLQAVIAYYRKFASAMMAQEAA